MGCGGSKARASTPVGTPPSQSHNESGRAGSAPVNGVQGELRKMLFLDHARPAQLAFLQARFSS